MPELPFVDRELKTIVFDVDGTLYRQNALRRAMLFRLLGAHAADPVRGWRTLRILREYRRAQEHLRETPDARDVAAEQIRIASARTNVGHDAVVECVRRWMEEEPLAFLPGCVQPHLLEFLRACKARGLRLGALSDYPAEAKLRALGIEEFFDEVLCAQSPDVDAFKPNPRGLLAAVERLGSTTAETLYIGDRVDVDAATAEAAGVRSAILTRHRAGGHVRFANYAQLQDLLWPPDARISAQHGDDAQNGLPLRRG